MQIWEFDSYREYLLQKLGPDGSRTGLRKKLAEFIPVHTTYVTLVLKEKAEFSLEQAEKINDFFNHSNDEGEYFLLLIMHERAGSQNLKKRFFRKIKEMRDQRLNVQKRIAASQQISKEDREKFYSSYYYPSIHVLTSIPDFQSVETLASALKINRESCQEMVDFLLKLGIIKIEKSKLVPGSAHVHLGTDSEMILRHHSNWRLHCLQNLQILNPQDLHYSGILSLSQEDAFKIKDILIEAIRKNIEIVRDSKEEVAYVMNIDFYSAISK